MYRIVTVMLLVCFSVLATAQIVSIDKRRTKNPNKGIQGDVNLGLNFVHTTTDMTSLSSQFKLQYNDDNNTYLLSSDVNFNQVDNEKNINNGGMMFKYNYWVPEKIIIAEAFMQYQYNRVKKLKHRYVFGLGPRFNISDREKFSFFIVAYSIYMNELFQEEKFERRKSLVKLSSMLSMDWRFAPNATLGHTTYYEPDYSDPEDFRIWSETKLDVKISSRFSFGLFLRMDYDHQVPTGVDNLFYSVNNSFKLAF
ncbi:DUF481 domain-containing protein [Marinilabiliaceae bacterium JC017]|nr:DUF481 domain-containing protein [Marinilabiliaceae bacterium JC017]